jgi:tetratricopeptide (TPR) repeat protein
MFGRYHIIRLLGSGGMGHVYHAWDGELGEAVALKVIRGEYLTSPEAEGRFKRELSISRQVTHKNVIRIYDLGDVDGVKFISMAFIDGMDLGSVIKTARPALEPALDIAQQLCAGLAAAHQAGVVHRDLKPANIMVDKSGAAYLMDFGLARSIDAQQYTVTGMMIGTVEYMSPEQATGKDADHRSDIFTLGIVLCELFTGERPYKGETAMSRLSARLQQPAPDPRLSHPELPAYISRIILRCLEREPEQRYQTVEEVGRDLAEQRAAAIPWKVKFRSGEFRKKIAVAGIVVLLLGGGTVVVSSLRNRAPVEQGETASGPVVSLAVLPFRNASGDPSLDYLSASIAEMLRNNVGQSSFLRTVSSARLYQILTDLRLSPQSNFDTATLQTIADQSNTDTLVSGQYSRLGDHIRLDVTYQDLKKQRSIPISVEAASEGELLKVIDQLADKIQHEVTSSPDLLKELRAKSFQPTSTSTTAMRYYSEGLELVHRGNNGEAVDRFKASTMEDASFALAFSRLAQAYSALGQDNEAERSSRQAMALAEKLSGLEKLLIEAVHARVSSDNDKAIEAYKKLVQVLPNDSDIHLALAGIYDETGKYDQARDEYDTVLKLDPKRLEALINIGRVEVRRKNPKGAIVHLNNALSYSVQIGNDDARGRILNAMGAAYKGMENYEEALNNYQQSLAVRRKLGQKAGIAQTLNEMAQAEDKLGQPELALTHYTESDKLYREVGDKRGMGSVLLNWGTFYSSRGNYDEAMKRFKESMQIQRELGNTSNEALCLNNMGNVYLLKGQFDDALTYFDKSLRLRETLNIPRDMAMAYHNLAETYAKLGQHDQALDHYLKAIDLRRKAGDKRGEALEQYGMGKIYQDQGRYDAALTAQEDALKVFQDSQERGAEMAEIVGGYGGLLSEIGRWGEAATHFETALNHARESRSDSIIAQILNLQGNASFYAGDLKTARKSYDDALAIASKTNAESLVLQIKANQARLAVKEGRGQSVIQSLQQLSSSADTSGLKSVSIACSISLGEALLKTKDYAKARSELDRALARAERLKLVPLQAQIHDLLGSILLQSGSRADAAPQFAEARKLLGDLSKSAPDLVKRSDFSPIIEHAKQYASP